MSIIVALLVGTGLAAGLSAAAVKVLLTLVPLNHKHQNRVSQESLAAPAE